MSELLAEGLVGTWSLYSYDVWSASGVRYQPLGAGPAGLLIYGADGYMSAQLMGGAAQEPIAYAGTYEVDEDGACVVHQVHVSLARTWVGHGLRRSVQLQGERLLLGATAREADGSTTRHDIAWRRTTR